MGIHKSVLLQEAVSYLNVKPGELYIDGTYGGGGHSREILKRGGRVLALDVSPQAVAAADQDPNLKVLQGNFSKLAEITDCVGVKKVTGVLFDLGISSDELEAVPGLSFQRPADLLDMRFDPSLGVTAADLLNALPEKKLEELFTTYGEDRFSWEIAKGVVRGREKKPFSLVSDLLEVIERVKGRKTQGIHPATQVWQALRIAVNGELESLKESLPQAQEILKPGGRIVVISFHSGEDRIVKNFFKSSGLKVLTDKPITPSAEEMALNPRSRSAKLRAAEQVASNK